MLLEGNIAHPSRRGEDEVSAVAPSPCEVESSLLSDDPDDGLQDVKTRIKKTKIVFMYRIFKFLAPTLDLLSPALHFSNFYNTYCKIHHMEKYRISTLKILEAESIHIIREVAAEFENPTLLYSVGKDSSVLAHLARKAFYPGKIPFPFLHVDTTYKFPEMYEFRDRFCKEIGVDLIVYKNEKALKDGANPTDWGTVKCCAALKTQALLAAIQNNDFDAAIGGARREEEKSRAKERVYSFRDKFGQWEPKNQRPELWNLYNGRINKGESIRVFPLSNWTELDIWQYIHMESIQVMSLYFAEKRFVKHENGNLIPVYGENSAETTTEMCRFRTLGCHYCTAAVRSEATSVKQIIEEMMTERQSERSTRIIDHDQDSSMEEKKKEGYF